MALAILHSKMDPAARRFVIWMAIGALFILALVAGDHFTGGSIW